VRYMVWYMVQCSAVQYGTWYSAVQCSTVHGTVHGTWYVCIPLSTEKLSVGSPAIFHARIATGSPNVSLNENTSDRGMPLALTDSVHSWICSCLNADVNAPR